MASNLIQCRLINHFYSISKSHWLISSWFFSSLSLLIGSCSAGDPLTWSRCLLSKLTDQFKRLVGLWSTSPALGPVLFLWARGSGLSCGAGPPGHGRTTMEMSACGCRPSPEMSSHPTAPTDTGFLAPSRFGGGVRRLYTAGTTSATLSRLCTDAGPVILALRLPGPVGADESASAISGLSGVPDRGWLAVTARTMRLCFGLPSPQSPRQLKDHLNIDRCVFNAPRSPGRGASHPHPPTDVNKTRPGPERDRLGFRAVKVLITIPAGEAPGSAGPGDGTRGGDPRAGTSLSPRQRHPQHRGGALINFKSIPNM